MSNYEPEASTRSTRTADGVASRGGSGARNGGSQPSASAGLNLLPGVANTPEAQEVLENARRLVPHLRERMIETEELRRLPEATVREADEAGIYGLLLPRSLGGAGGGAREFVQLVRTLARGHLSAAWTISFLVEHNWMLARFPPEAQRDLFVNGRPAMMSGVISPPGKAVPADGGYILDGYWGYATAVMHANWVMVFAEVDAPVRELLVFLVPKLQVTVDDTWFMSGMGGTGSNHIRVDHQFVPRHRTVDLELWACRQNPGSTLHPEAIYSYSMRDVLGFMYPAMAVGAAEVMLEEYRQRIERRRAPYTPHLIADTATGQLRYARAAMALRTAQATLEHTLERTVQANAETAEDLPFELRAKFKLAQMSVLRMAWESIDIGVRGSGTSIFKEDSSTQFYVRDMEMLLSHQTIDEDTMLTKAGELLLGRAADINSALI